MPKLHELLAAEKTPTGAWNTLFEDTTKKFKNPTHYFEGHSKSLAMIEDSQANKAVEGQAREEKPVTTNVYETLEYALEVFRNAEDLQMAKNFTNANARATVMFRGKELLKDVPVDELLGLEARLTKIRLLVVDAPTLDGTKHWEKSQNGGAHVFESKFPEITTKTEKVITPVVMSPATDKHPAQVQPITKDTVVGSYTLVKRSGAATTDQKANAIKQIDELLVEIKQARMRANETQVVVMDKSQFAQRIVDLILEPFKQV